LTRKEGDGRKEKRFVVVLSDGLSGSGVVPGRSTRNKKADREKGKRRRGEEEKRRRRRVSSLGLGGGHVGVEIKINVGIEPFVGDSCHNNLFVI